MKQIAISIAASLVGLMVALAIVEVGVRLFVPVRVESGPGWSDRPQFYYRSPTVPTMQDYPYAVPKPPSTFRIAVVGDSFTFAPYMQFTDTFPKKLEQILNINGSSLKAEVINYGVPAYSTSHEVPVIKRALDEGADLILLQITLNDPEIKAHRPTGIREDMDDRFGALKLTGAKAWLARHWRTYGFVLTRLHNNQTHQAYIDYFNNLFQNPRTYKQFSDSMAKITSLTQDAGKPIMAIVFPLFGIPMDANYPFYPIHTKVHDLLVSLKVPDLDISSIYQGIPLERMQVIPGVDRHPNEIAHRMAAEKIYTWLEESHAIPADLRLKEKFATRLGTANQRPLTQQP